jgi:hypothetical protein
MTSMGGPRNPCEELCKAIEEMEECYQGDPAYKEILFKLDQVEQDLETIMASPGRRAALRALPANAAGQEPRERSEPPSYVS